MVNCQTTTNCTFWATTPVKRWGLWRRLSINTGWWQVMHKLTTFMRWRCLDLPCQSVTGTMDKENTVYLACKREKPTLWYNQITSKLLNYALLQHCNNQLSLPLLLSFHYTEKPTHCDTPLLWAWLKKTGTVMITSLIDWPNKKKHTRGSLCERHLVNTFTSYIQNWFNKKKHKGLVISCEGHLVHPITLYNTLAHKPA